jgi:catechol 2,3-dioxygenase-like lactoylglutathione lyase family enzyme
MAKLRHIAMAVSDIAKTAKFYEDVFGMPRVRETPISVTLSDGVVNLVLIDNTKFPLVKGHHGVHHIGFIVDDVEAMHDRIESSGGANVDEAEVLAANRKRKNEGIQQEERKFHDPEGLNFDIVNDEHARKIWHISA